MWPIGVLRYGRGKQEVGSPSIFVVEAVHIICCTGSRLQKTRRESWEAILGLRYFELAKVVTEGRRTSQGKAAHGHVVYAVQEVLFWAPFDAVF